MAAIEAKWQAGVDKGKAPARTEAGAKTSLAKKDDNGDLTTNRYKEGSLIDEVLMAMKPSNMRINRLQIAGFYLEGDASEWFHWMKRNRMLYGSHDFWEKVEQMFNMMQFEDPLADLAKLMQTRTVGDFQAMFEKLLSKLTGPLSHN
nr:uncharacterized protein LOC109179602 [Ipomoea trifida]